MGKRLVQGVVLLAIFLLMPVSLIGIWVRQEVADTDAYVASVQDLPAKTEVQDAVVQIIVNDLRTRVGTDWQTFVASTVSNQAIRTQLLALDVDVPTFVGNQIRTLMQRPDFPSTWASINRTAHPLVKDVLLGHDTDVVETAHGDIRLNLAPIYAALVGELGKQGIDLSRVAPASGPDLWLTIYSSDSLQQTQRVARLIDRWAIPLLVIVAVLALLVVVLSQRKALAGAVIGLTVLLSMAVALVGLSLAIRFALDRNLDRVERDAALTVVREVTASLREWALMVGAAGAVVMLVCLVAQSLGRHQTRAVYRR